jgi:patatin-like phospholipase/acyl hydrolase
MSDRTLRGGRQMKEFRENLALAIDGGGYKGVLVASALKVLEKELNVRFAERAGLMAGTSTGAIISTALAAGMSAEEIHEYYKELGPRIFPRRLRTRWIFPYLVRFRYSSRPLKRQLREKLSSHNVNRMEDLLEGESPNNVIITAFDICSRRIRFVKPWKEEYRRAHVWDAVLASSTIPTYFPVAKVQLRADENYGRYVDGGLGAHYNPAYLAAFEIAKHADKVDHMAGWTLENTTLLSIGTGLDPLPECCRPHRWRSIQWIGPIIESFISEADRQQVHVVENHFPGLDFRRYQVLLREVIPADDARMFDRLTRYGEELAEQILAED